MASAPMAKPRSIHGVTLTYPATTAYKQWVRAQMDARGWTFQHFVDEMKRKAKPELLEIIDSQGRTKYETISTATISDFLGPDDVVPTPSNSKLLPAINKTLGAPPPPVSNPGSELEQLVDTFRDRWGKLTPNERLAIAALLGRRET